MGAVGFFRLNSTQKELRGKQTNSAEKGRLREFLREECIYATELA